MGTLLLLIVGLLVVLLLLIAGFLVVCGISFMWFCGHAFVRGLKNRVNG